MGLVCFEPDAWSRIHLLVLFSTDSISGNAMKKQAENNKPNEEATVNFDTPSVLHLRWISFYAFLLLTMADKSIVC